MKKLSPILLVVGLILVAAGVLMPILGGNPFGMTFRYVFAAGAGLTLIARLFAPAPPQNTPLRIKRLLRLESWSAIFFCVAAFFAFYSAPALRDWLAFTLAGAAVQIVSTVMISIASRPKKK